MNSLPFRVLWTVALVTVTAATTEAQKPWIRPEPPCEISPGHRLVNGAVLQLQQGVEAENQETRDTKLLEARDLLLEAIVDSEQGTNPAAWYYLGRYYVEVQDAVGVDSAFRKAEELAATCADDISLYRTPISAVAMNDAAIAWQGGSIDSAATLFRLAYKLDDANANALLFLASMYAGDGQLDSAAKYVSVGSEVAGDNPSFRSRRRRAMLDVARAYSDIANKEPAIGRAAQARWTRDSLALVIERDSTILADLIAEWAGRRLRPEVQARVSRDSTTVANRLSSARTSYAAAKTAAANDSVTANSVLAKPIAVYTSYAAAFPEDEDASMTLITYHAATGNQPALNSAIDELTASGSIAASGMLQTGLNLLNSGSAEGAARILEAVIDRNPYSRDALLLLARAHYRLRNEAPLMDVARRLLEIDPLNQQSNRMMAGAWEVADQRDSANKYVRLANAGIGWHVTVSQFLPSENSTVLNGSVGNITNAARPPVTLIFEFLGPTGDVIGSVSTDVPALQSGALHRISVNLEQGGAVGWRYRKG